MPRTLRVLVGTLLILYSWASVHAQPTLTQPANGATVFVPLPPFPMARPRVAYLYSMLIG